ncbi:MAG: hypothetical protein M3460_04505 [Actinomycetota bacterium]|nr:hypothetical protein [Actinomycetota bacterium]
MRDHVYDASSRALPQLAYRKGDLGGANPGVDSSWRASAILARITVAAAATSITNAAITDLRTAGDTGGVSKTLADAKGDLIVASAADTFARHPVGTDGHVLTAASAEARGVKWAAPAYTLLGETVLASSAATITFGSIPQTHKHLHCVMRCLSSPTGFAQIKCRQNGISTATYESQVLYALNATVTAVRVVTLTSMEVGIIGDANPSTSEFVLADYTNTTTEKLLTCRSAYLDSGIYPVNWSAASHNYNDTAAITQLQFFPATGSFAAGTRISLYGMG